MELTELTQKEIELVDAWRKANAQSVHFGRVVIMIAYGSPTQIDLEQVAYKRKFDIA